MIRACLVTVTALVLSLPAVAQPGGGQPGMHFIEQWDDDGDGRVTADELKLRRGDVFYMFDADENGVLDAGEYAVFDETRAADMAASREAGGRHGQGQGPGAAGRPDFLNIVGEGMGLAFNDVDGDGAVTLAEFEGSVDSWLALMDQNGDGVVSAGDFPKPRP